MSATLFKRSLRSAAAVMAAIVVVLAFYIAMVAYLYDPEVSESIQLMQAAMPELFEAFGMANPSATLLDFLLNYLYGFLFTGTLVLMAAYLAQRLVVGPVRDGSLAWLLAAPRSRLSLALTFVAVEVAAVAIVVGLSWGAEVIACEALFPGRRPLAAGALRRLRPGGGRWGSRRRRRRPRCGRRGPVRPRRRPLLPPRFQPIGSCSRTRRGDLRIRRGDLLVALVPEARRAIAKRRQSRAHGRAGARPYEVCFRSPPLPSRYSGL